MYVFGKELYNKQANVQSAGHYHNKKTLRKTWSPCLGLFCDNDQLTFLF